MKLEIAFDHLDYDVPAVRRAPQVRCCSPFTYLAELRTRRRATFPQPVPTPRPANHSTRAYLRAARAAELAAWHASGGDVLRASFAA